MYVAIKDILMPASIENFSNPEDGVGGLRVKYQVGNKKFTALFDHISGSELFSGLSRPEWISPKERLHFNTNQLGGYNV